MLCVLRGSNASGRDDDDEEEEEEQVGGGKFIAIFRFFFVFLLLEGEIINFAQQTNQSDFIVLSFDYVPPFDCTRSFP